MAKKVYAIKEGYDFEKEEKIKNIIVDTWDECLKYVKGVSGARYKSFPSRQEAEVYLSNGKKLLKKDQDSYPMDCLHIYVDGSYNIETEKYSYGFVVIKNDRVIYIENGAPEDTSKKQLRQIAGELEAAQKAVEYAVSKGEKKLVIFHDYEGICHHAIGTWERRDESSKNYYNTMNDYIKNKRIEIIFVKTDSHTGDIFNEIADSLAKSASGNTLTSAVDRWLSGNSLTVSSSEIKEKLSVILKPSNYDKVIVK